MRVAKKVAFSTCYNRQMTALFSALSAAFSSDIWRLADRS